MSELVRFGVAFDEELLARLDAHVEKTGYANRSELIRDLVRNTLVEEDLQTDAELEVNAALTIVFDHHVRELEDRLTNLQHDFHNHIVSTLHVHVSAHDCMEILVLRGKNSEVKALANRIMGMKGVKHGQLTMALASSALHSH